ncbi:putative cytochrome p450 protein [Botryosphaeria dothidea]|uniref:Cytochrome p450 protein n=1 Tax=Botryosphaeria dothidea TaxID=55169 RepID=A0A8H4N4L8_9PEZI|nr:putative cytochrome p450 protein [Botryosphaeria dothidea]
MTFIVQSTVLSIGAAALLLISYGLYSLIYNLYFHPLRRFPGPKLAAASKLPYVIYRCRGLQAEWTTRCHDRYGQVVRLAPDQLSFTSVEAWRDIYGHKVAGRGGMPKDLRFYGPDSAGFNGIIRTNDEDHARHRRLLAHAFSDKALREQEPLIRKYVDLLAERLGDVARIPWSSPASAVDMVRMYNYTTFDIMGDLAFGEALGLLERAEYTPWVASIFGTIRAGVLIGTINNNFPSLGAVIRRFLVPQSLLEKRKAHARYSEQRVDARLAKQTDRPDIWTFVLRHSEADGKGLRLAEMHADGSTLMLAGTETTATLLSGLTYHLLLNPAKMALLTREIRAAFTHPDQMNMVTLGRLKYMHACLEEGLRMYPPVPVGLPRVVPPEGRVVCGESLPGGTSVYLSHYAAYHSAANFHAPDEFLPERWLEEPEERFRNDALGVVEPFSYGPRNCIGKNLAYHEMRLILANTLWHFDLELCPESKNWQDQRVYIIWEKQPLMCKLKPAKRE